MKRRFIGNGKIPQNARDRKSKPYKLTIRESATDQGEYLEAAVLVSDAINLSAENSSLRAICALR
jgi:hypothetical protein